MVIHPGLPDGDDLGMPGQRGKFPEKIHRALVENVARMQPDHRVNIVVFFRDGQRLAAAGAIDAYGNDTAHAGLAGTGNDGVELTLELGEIKMRVGVGEHGCYQRTTDEAQVNPPPKTTMRMWSPRPMRPLRWASSRAMATAAADVFP